MFLTKYNSQPDIRCRHCLEWIQDPSAGCQTCHGQGRYKSVETPSLFRRLIGSVETPSLIRRLIDSFRTEMSTELVVLTLESPDRLFSDKEIDVLLDLEEMAPLELEEVPNWHLMFLDSKKIKKPERTLTPAQNERPVRALPSGQKVRTIRPLASAQNIRLSLTN